MLSHVGKYEVKQLLGKGATGSVYLVGQLRSWLVGTTPAVEPMKV